MEKIISKADWGGGGHQTHKSPSGGGAKRLYHRRDKRGGREISGHAEEKKNLMKLTLF